ncbi:MAG: AAA family ATPase [Hahellaceae bacterium]|nr:AAA family ATPase [Hahellaceae bacterium]
MLLKTKFLAPASNARSVERSRLLKRLMPRMGRKIVLLTAPAGYGKTTLVSQWLHKFEKNYCWLSLDDSDNQPLRFWQYVIGAIQQRHPQFGTEANQLLKKVDDLPFDAVVTAIVNELHAIVCEQSEPLNLILDDFHVVKDPAIHRQLAYLIDFLPPGFQIVITSRIEPALPIARWRVKNWVDEIHATDLSFNEDECDKFFRYYLDLNLTEEEIQKIREKTEGWVAAMQLAAMSVQTVTSGATNYIKPLSGEDKLINDYVLSEILEQQSEDLQTFLLDSSCLLRISSDICDYIREKTDSQQFLDSLEQRNLFLIPLDTTHSWYRYHDLFRESLHLRLRQQNPQRVRQLQRRAVEWFMAHDQFQEAITQLIQLADWAWLGEVLKTHGNTLIHKGYNLQVLSWVAHLPDEMLDNTPRLLMLQVWALFFSNKLDVIHPLLNRLEDLLDRRVADSHPDAAGALALHSEISLIRSYLARLKSDLQSAGALSERVLKELDHSNMPLKSVTYYGIGMDCFMKGDLKSAKSALLSAIEYGKLEKKHPTVLSSTGLLGWVLLQQNEIDFARETCITSQQWIDSYYLDPEQPRLVSCWQNTALAEVFRERLELTVSQSYVNPLLKHLEKGTEAGQHIMIQYVRAHLAFAQQDFKNAIDYLDDAINVFDHKRDTILFDPPPLGALRARCYLSCGELEKAQHWLKQLDKQDFATSPLNREQNQITAARVLICTGKGAEAADRLQATISACRDAEHLRNLTEALSCLSMARLLTGENELSCSNITEALELADNDKLYGIFTEELPLIKECLKYADIGEISEVFQHKLEELLDISLGKSQLNESFTIRTPLVTPGKITAPELLEPISQRELEVLELINHGLANKEIAQKLGLSPATVKAHIRNLYGKIGAKSRTEALAKARDMEIIK